MPFTVIEVFPILHILRQVDFLGCPERSFMAFVHFPYVGMFDGEQNKPQWIFDQQGLLSGKFL
jgi:hypothetical protein